MELVVVFQNRVNKSNNTGCTYCTVWQSKEKALTERGASAGRMATLFKQAECWRLVHGKHTEKNDDVELLKADEAKAIRVNTTNS